VKHAPARSLRPRNRKAGQHYDHAAGTREAALRSALKSQCAFSPERLQTVPNGDPSEPRQIVCLPAAPVLTHALSRGRVVFDSIRRPRVSGFLPIADAAEKGK
jgi:hypothetical protein